MKIEKLYEKKRAVTSLNKRQILIQLMAQIKLLNSKCEVLHLVLKVTIIIYDINIKG